MNASGTMGCIQAERFLSNATRAQREVICRDLEPIINIYNQLKP